MPENAPESSDESRTGHDREILRSALSGMSTAQLQELHTTIIRLEHLPFTRLVETLFTPQAVQGSGAELPTEIYRGSCVSVQDLRGQYGSKAKQDLREDVETILKARIATTG